MLKMIKRARFKSKSARGASSCIIERKNYKNESILKEVLTFSILSSSLYQAISQCIQLLVLISYIVALSVTSFLL